jgi:hypothetical protein
MTKILMTVLVMMSLTIAVGSLVACSSSASLVRKDALGGRVQLQGAYMPAMGDARMLMVEHCHGRFEYEELGHAVEFRCTGHGTRPSMAEGALALGMSGQRP